MRYILALDQGTTSSRALLFDHAGRVVSSAQRELVQHYPRPGWVEHDPAEILAGQWAVAAEAMARAGAGDADIAAIGIANQRETVVLWERSSGRALHPAIVWQDRRTADMCDRLRADGHEAEVTARTGLLLDPYFSATKLRWLLDHVTGARERARRGELAAGTVDSWLLWHLTGGKVHATEPGNAARTLLFNLHTGDWDTRLLELFDIPPALLPEVRDSCGPFGRASLPGLALTAPITGVAGDQQAALFGQCCFSPGMVKNTYGTGCFMLMNTGDQPRPSPSRLLATVAWQKPDGRTYALEGSVFVGGAVVQWLRDGLGMIGSSGEVEALAASVPDSGGVCLVPAFAGLGTPWWDAHARGILVGLTRGTGKGHIARAALEAIAFQVADVLRAMQRDAGIALSGLRVDGGAAVNNLLMQFQADVLGVPVVRPAVTEATALGAASLAGLGCGFWSNTGELAALWRVEREFQPRMGEPERQQRLAHWTRAVERARGWDQGG